MEGGPRSRFSTSSKGNGGGYQLRVGSRLLDAGRPTRLRRFQKGWWRRFKWCRSCWIERGSSGS